MKLLITMPKGLVRDSFLNERTLYLFNEHFTVTINEMDRNYTSSELWNAAQGMDVLVTGWGTPHLGQAGLLEAGSSLKLIVHTGGSVADLIDHRAYEHGMTVISGNSMYAESTAEGALSYILTALRHLPDEICSMRREGYWNDGSKLLTGGLFGRTIGIIGVGAVARNLMRFLKPFRVRILVYDTYTVEPEFLEEVNGTQTDLTTLLTDSSIISVHASLTEQTRNMLGAREFSQIRDGALFVNTSRGAIINEKELITELAKGRFRAILDVYTKEPLEADSPLRSMSNVYLVPHKGGPTFDYRASIGYALAEDAVRFLNHEPLQYEIPADAASRMTRHH